ncbi:helix-turn-helix domain-containing protein [Candidatus Nitrososphaera gargensis]|nr:helix-turn-helix domain-containing protein [Candidatus Nitrososphaera gargensis]
MSAAAGGGDDDGMAYLAVYSERLVQMVEHKLEDSMQRLLMPAAHSADIVQEVKALCSLGGCKGGTIMKIVTYLLERDAKTKEIADTFGINISTAHRSLERLEQHGFASKEERSRLWTLNKRRFPLLYSLSRTSTVILSTRKS